MKMQMDWWSQYMAATTPAERRAVIMAGSAPPDREIITNAEFLAADAKGVESRRVGRQVIVPDDK
ncbi:MAG TPA: hypothetical protein VJB95_00340 [Candidatus Paceibacterota bacterium]